MTRPARTLLLFAVLACAAFCAGCVDEPDRNPVPRDLLDDVRLPGFEAVRFWGDVNTPVFEKAMTRQFEDLKASAAAGKLPKADQQTDVLAISGGGDQGAFAAGFLRGWSDRGTRPRFDTVTGVSTGALAAPFAFLGAAKDAQLEEIYTRNGAAQLYDSRWDFGLIGNAVKDTGPLRELIEKRVDESFLDAIAEQHRLGRRLLVSTTNLDAQRPVIWDLSAIAASKSKERRRLFVDILVATAAVPGIFPPVRLAVIGPDGKSYDELHGDGSITMEMFFLPPKIKLAEAERRVFGHTRERTLYVLRNGRLFPEYSKTPEKALAIVQRGVMTLVKYQVVYNLRMIESAARANDTRFQFMGIPKTFRGPTKAKFDSDYAQELFAKGRDSGSKNEWVLQVPDSPELAP